MKTIRDYQFISDSDRGAAVAIGNFDGVHTGHQAVIDIARDHAKRLGAPLGVMTFEPHPRVYFAPDAPAFRLMSAEAKGTRLEKLGVEKLYELNFNAALCALTAEEFARDVIAHGLGLSHVVVGADFRFGKGRVGTTDDLIAFGKTFGFGVTVVELVSETDVEISSTQIRTALSEGRPRDAARMLGHWHRIEGEVIGGDQRGRELGFPTANMPIDGLQPPKFGVYAVLVNVLTGPHKGAYKGAASIGSRPTFGDNKPNLETFLFDFKGDLYGATLSIGLVEYLRPELKFTSVNWLDELVAAMDADCVQARAILADIDNV
jgi:riboflavin kinase/FMN adenylyltransferase